MPHFPYFYRGVLVTADVNGTVYHVSSVEDGFEVLVAVPSDEYMRNAENTALHAANAGIKFIRGCRVNRVCYRRKSANGGT